MNEEEIKNIETPETEDVQQEQKSRGLAKMRSRYAELEPEGGWGEASDDDIADRAMADSDASAERIKKYEENDKKMDELFSNNPESANFLIGMAEGKNMYDNLKENFGEYIVEALQDEEKLGELKAQHDDEVKKIAKNKELQTQWEDNMIQSLGNIASAQEELGLSDEEVDASMDALKEVVDQYNTGNITMDTVKMFMNARNHDTDVANAKREGEIDGRNAKITESLRKRKAEDYGTPSLGGQSGTAQGNPFSNKNAMGAGGSIWDRGNFKRNVED